MCLAVGQRPRRVTGKSIFCALDHIRFRALAVIESRVVRLTRDGGRFPVAATVKSRAVVAQPSLSANSAPIVTVPKIFTDFARATIPC